jgi:NAD+ dependent glucose-6-phosphate dehydrogenase
MSGKILITGAFGRCGTALFDLDQEKVLFDIFVPGEYQGQPNVIEGAIQDTALLEKSMRGCDAVVHLAASPAVSSSWEDVLQNNIVGMKSVLQAAKSANVKRVIFASTNHVVGMVELENTPRIFEPGHGIMLTKESELRPDSYYGVSKILGEQLGRYEAENGGPRFFALRIGSLHPANADHPYAEAEAAVVAGRCQRGDGYYEEKVKRQKALWLSRRDFAQLVSICLTYDGPLFDIFYAVSANPNRWLDIEYARAQLGYTPQDNAEAWAELPQAVEA